MTARTLVTAFALTMLVSVTAAALAEPEPLPFELPTPEGWRTETLPFPLEFAPELPYTGLEELRFAPGMFEKGSETFWSYGFVWWIGSDEPTGLESMAGYLEDYFRGLAHAVAQQREFEIGEATFTASLEAGEGRAFTGRVDTFDAFVTRGQVRLNVRGEVLSCATENRQAVIFLLSPQGAEHSVWETLSSIGRGFSCLRQ